MLHELKIRISGLVITLVLLIAGGTLSAIGQTGNSSSIVTSPALSASTDLQSCQVIPSLGAPCSKDGNHPDAARNNHCIQHCSHSQAGMLSALNLPSPDITHLRVEHNLQRIPESVTFDPGSRPPIL